MKKRKIKISVRKALLGILVLITLAGVLPFSALATGDAGEGNSCTHVCGVDACSYAEGQECTFPGSHEHETGCGYTAGDDSTCSVFAAHQSHDEACGFNDEEGGSACSVIDSHTHETGCGYSGEEGSSCAAIAGHLHDSGCGYAEVVACNHECGEACGIENTAPEGDGKEGTPPQTLNENIRGAGDNSYRIKGRVFIDKDMNGEYTDGEGLADYTVVGAILKDDPDNPGQKLPFGKDSGFDLSTQTDSEGIFSFEDLLETDEMAVYFQNPSEYYEVIVYEGNKVGEDIKIVTVGPRVESGHSFLNHSASSSTEPSFTMTTGYVPTYNIHFNANFPSDATNRSWKSVEPVKKYINEKIGANDVPSAVPSCYNYTFKGWKLKGSNEEPHPAANIIGREMTFGMEGKQVYEAQWEPKSPPSGSGDLHRIVGRVYIDYNFNHQYDKGEGVEGHAIRFYTPKNMPSGWVPVPGYDNYDETIYTDENGLYVLDGLPQDTVLTVAFYNIDYLKYHKWTRYVDKEDTITWAAEKLYVTAYENYPADDYSLNPPDHSSLVFGLIPVHTVTFSPNFPDNSGQRYETGYQEAIEKYITEYITEKDLPNPEPSCQRYEFKGWVLQGTTDTKPVGLQLNEKEPTRYRFEGQWEPKAINDKIIGRVYLDEDFSLSYTNGEGLGGVKVQLYRDGGRPTLNTTTEDDGTFTFDGLEWNEKARVNIVTPNGKPFCAIDSNGNVREKPLSAHTLTTTTARENPGESQQVVFGFVPQYTIKFDPAFPGTDGTWGGTTETKTIKKYITQSIEVSDLPGTDPECSNYTFDGWTLSGSDKDPIGMKMAGEPYSLTFVGQWTKTGPEPKPVEVLNLINISLPVKDARVFNAKGNPANEYLKLVLKEYTVDGSAGEMSDLVIVGHPGTANSWNGIPAVVGAYSVRVTTPNGLSKVATITVTNDTYSVTYKLNNPNVNQYSIKVEVGAAVPLPSVGRENHRFAGWKNETDGGYFTAGMTMPEHDIVLSAQWNYINPGSNPDPTPSTPVTPVGPPAPPPVVAPVGPSSTVETPVVEPEGDAIPPEGTPEADAALPTENIDGDDALLAQGLSQNRTTWSLLNLIISLLAIVLFARELTKNISKKYKSEGAWRKILNVLTYVLGVVIPVLFMLTNDLTSTMVLADQLTLIFVLLVAVESIALLLSTKKVNDDDDYDYDEENPAPAAT